MDQFFSLTKGKEWEKDEVIEEILLNKKTEDTVTRHNWKTIKEGLR